jgi:CO/xanthine dehydrogenase FAD-binding subunit
MPRKINEPNRTRITVGGDRINYQFEVATPTADLLTVKLLLNSVISTEGARFASVDIKNFYLCTPLTRYKYVRMNLANFPEDVIEQYKLKELANKTGMVFVEIRKGMYGLPQAGLLAQELLEQRLNKHGYYQSN